MNILLILFALGVLWAVVNTFAFFMVRRQILTPMPWNWRALTGPHLYYRWNDQRESGDKSHQIVEEGRLVWCYCDNPQVHLIKDIEADVVKPINQVILDAERVAQNDYDRWAKDQEHWTPWFEGDQLLAEQSKDKPAELEKVDHEQPTKEEEFVEFELIMLDGESLTISVPLNFRSRYGPYGYGDWRKKE